MPMPSAAPTTDRSAGDIGRMDTAIPAHFAPQRATVRAVASLAAPSATVDTRRGALMTFTHRPARVVLLLIATLILAAGDLALTLNYVTSIGMIEANPLARLIMKLGSVTGIVLWKIFLTAFSVGVLYRFRAKGIAEAAAWISAGIMLALMYHWIGYVAEIDAMANEYAIIASAANGNHEGWIILN